MIHANANHSIRYMPNARHGAYPAMLPQGFPSAMVSQQHDDSSITTAVASAGPAEQQQVIMEFTLLSFNTSQILKCFKSFNTSTNFQVDYYKFLDRVSHVDHELIYSIADISWQIKIFVVPLKVHQ